MSIPLLPRMFKGFIKKKDKIEFKNGKLNHLISEFKIKKSQFQNFERQIKLV